MSAIKITVNDFSSFQNLMCLILSPVLCGVVSPLLPPLPPGLVKRLTPPGGCGSSQCCCGWCRVGGFIFPPGLLPVFHATNFGSKFSLHVPSLGQADSNWTQLEPENRFKDLDLGIFRAAILLARRLAG